MDVSFIITRDYEKKTNRTLSKNKPKQSQICVIYRGERGVRRAKEYMRNFLPNKEIQSESSFSAVSANSAVNEKQSQFRTWPCKNGSLRVSTVEVISLECKIDYYGNIFAG